VEVLHGVLSGFNDLINGPPPVPEDDDRFVCPRTMHRAARRHVLLSADLFQIKDVDQSRGTGEDAIEPRVQKGCDLALLLL